MTREEAILLSAYTGFLLAPDFSEVHKFCEDTIGRPIWTHEFADSCVQKEIQEKLRPQIMELVQNIAALRPVSREQVERMFPGCKMCSGWNTIKLKPCVNGDLGVQADIGSTGKGDTFGLVVYGHLLASGYVDFPFCPFCGKPKTDAAVEMVMERMDALHDTEN